MTKATIPEDEWEALVDLFYDIEDALEADDDKQLTEYIFDLNTQLDRLEEKYGQLAMLVATRADYCDDLEQQQNLYQQALKLAEEQQDEVIIVQTLESLYTLTIEELDNKALAEKWRKELHQAVDRYGDEWLCEPLEGHQS